MAPLPAPAAMYRALVARDASFDGVFIVGVKTTGIFCRPTCTAKKPRAENVEYFATTNAAQASGYRACKRCRPLELPGEHPEWARRLLAELDRRPSQRITDKRLAKIDISPARARRYFRGQFGMTFQAFQRARQLGLALERLESGNELVEVAMDSGYDSQSGFRDAFRKLFGEPPGRARGARSLVVSRLSSPVGPLFAAATREGVCLLEFADRPAIASQAASLRQWFDEPIVPGTNRHLDRLARELAEYFGGERTEFTVPLAIAGTPFQRKVWDALLAIPFGETRSYAHIARKLDRAGSQRVVGRANGLNRLAIVIPCHRVVRDDGTLCGYGGGLWRKRHLLDLEQRVLASR